MASPRRKQHIPYDEEISHVATTSYSVHVVASLSQSAEVAAYMRQLLVMLLVADDVAEYLVASTTGTA